MKGLRGKENSETVKELEVINQQFMTHNERIRAFILHLVSQEAYTRTGLELAVHSALGDLGYIVHCKEIYQQIDKMLEE